MARRIKGAARVRSLLKRIEPAMRDEMIAVLTDGGREMAAAMRADAPVLKAPHKGRTAGALVAGFTFKVYPKTLKLRVGLVGKSINKALFYARILEFGRGIKRQFDTLGRRIGVIQPLRYVYGRRPDLRRAVDGRLRGIWKRALQKASAGAGGTDD
jgi:hypothetical protein